MLKRNKIRYVVISFSCKKMIELLNHKEDQDQFLNLLNRIEQHSRKKYQKWYVPKFYLFLKLYSAIYPVLLRVESKLKLQ